MSRKKNPLPLAFLFLGGVILMVSFMWPEPANAQCGSQASSCKNCHEVQAEAPVNNDGTNWHEAHAFGDFCEFCHAGNVQATDIDTAHTGMVAPLDDVKAGCATCHPDDLMEKAEVYAATLGVAIGGTGGTGDSSSSGSSGDASSADAPSADDASANTTTAAIAPVSNEMLVDDPNVVDYVQRYNEIVLGYTPTNWGNVTLIVLIGAIILGGGAFIVKNENWLSVTDDALTAVPVGYSAETVALLPQISQLNSDGQEALTQLLENPTEAAQLFQSVSKLRK